MAVRDSGHLSPFRTYKVASIHETIGYSPSMTFRVIRVLTLIVFHYVPLAYILALSVDCLA